MGCFLSMASVRSRLMRSLLSFVTGISQTIQVCLAGWAFWGGEGEGELSSSSLLSVVDDGAFISAAFVVISSSFLADALSIQALHTECPQQDMVEKAKSLFHDDRTSSQIAHLLLSMREADVPLSAEVTCFFLPPPPPPLPFFFPPPLAFLLAMVVVVRGGARKNNEQADDNYSSNLRVDSTHTGKFGFRSGHNRRNMTRRATGTGID